MLASGCLGLLFALLARDRVRADGLFATPAFGFVATFAALMVAPGALYLAWAHPDWSWMYLVDSSTLSAILAPAWAIVCAGALLAAWMAGGLLTKAGHPRRAVITTSVLGLVLLAVVVGLADRLASYGTYETFAHGVGFGLLEVKLGYVLIVLALAVAAAASHVALELARDSRRVRAR